METGHNPQKILIVDDESTIRQSFSDYLEDLNFLTKTAQNGHIAIEILDRDNFDLILTDLRMPELDGLELIRHCNQSCPDTPIIVVSGAGRIKDAIEALRLGAWDYILKPIKDLSELEYRIAKAFEKADLIRENKMYQENLEQLVEKRTAALEKAYTKLVDSEERYRKLFERSSDAIFLVDADTGKYINANLAAEKLTGFSITEIKSKTTKDLAPIGASERLELLRSLNASRSFGEVVYERPDGSKRTAILNTFPIGEGRLIVGIAHDITELNQKNEELKKLGTAMRQSPVMVMITNSEGIIEYVNPKFSQVTGYASEDVIGKNSRILQGGETPPEEYHELWKTILKGNEWHGVFHNKKKDGNLYWEESSISPLLNDMGEITHFIALKEDITERKRADEALKGYVKRLDALHQIDQAITSSLELKTTLKVFLDHLLTLLGVNAAIILKHQKEIQTLTFVQGQGLSTTSYQYPDLKLGESLAGEVAYRRNQLFISNIQQTNNQNNIPSWFIKEGFMAYYGIPLIAKGNLVGVLEICHRSELNPDNEWLEFLQVLAGQAAIAIDNATLFNDLQRSNVELALAYDATIAGWSRALEIRDMETEGHSRRVVDLANQLAQKMGMSERELIHIRRGAMLHDIGKMGIPDRILQKPGPLTEEEWQVMRKHPLYAFEWLSPIDYLRPALDIPYCHHEKWNGKGYPRGLKGQEIPLSARIFTVIDVWDALSSNRPYRDAWPKNKIINYIQKQSGIHFDPEIVEEFIKIIGKSSI